MSILIDIITSQKAENRNQSLESALDGKTTKNLLIECAGLEEFRNETTNLYFKVRALFFLYAIHRFYLPNSPEITGNAVIPFKAHEHILNRRFEEAIKILLDIQTTSGINEGLSSALANAYYKLAFQTLANQVKRSVRTTPGNNWMFRIGHPQDHPLKIRKELLKKIARVYFHS